jgi:hypothetical protein
VGKGFCSDVYAWGEGRVLKLFHDSGAGDRVDREFAATRAVHAAELPVPAAYEVVEVDGRRGIVFERIDGVSLLKYTQARPWTIFGAVRLLAELHAQIHCCTAPPGHESGSRPELTPPMPQAGRTRSTSQCVSLGGHRP